MLNFQKAVYDPDRSVSVRVNEPPVGVITVEMVRAESYFTVPIHSCFQLPGLALVLVSVQDISGVAESILDIKFFEASSASLVKEDGTVVADKNWDSKNQDTVSTTVSS